LTAAQSANSSAAARALLGIKTLTCITERRIIFCQKRRQNDFSSLSRTFITPPALATDLRCAVQAAREIGAIPILVAHANRFGPGPRPDDYYWLTGWRLQYPEIRQGALLDLEARVTARIRAVAE